MEGFGVRRSLLPLLVVTALIPVSVSAATWQHFSSKSFGIKLQYPPGWHITTSVQPKQVALQYQGRQVYSFQVTVLGIKPGSSLSQTLGRVKAYEQSLGDAAFSSIHWSATSIGGRGAMAGIFRPSTEGGVAISTAIYVTASRSHVYQVTLVDYRRPPARTLATFPTVYHQILSSWRFL
jgi:hypothetical protein